MSREAIGLVLAVAGVIVLILAITRAVTTARADRARRARARTRGSRPRTAEARAPEVAKTVTAGASTAKPTATPTAKASTSAAPPAEEPTAAPVTSAPPSSQAQMDLLPSLGSEDDDDDVTRITLRSHLERAQEGRPLDEEVTEDDVAAATRAHPILFDEDAAADEPTGPVALFLVSGTAVTDRGKVRRRNEDAFLAQDLTGLYVVADGMGGYAGGDVASQLAVETMTQAFGAARFGTTRWQGLPRRAMELASAIDLANGAIFAKAQEDARLRGMGTTVVSARFSPKKQRLYIGHVGDSRCYRVRGGKIVAMTSDHTLAAVGVGGAAGARLYRAVGIEAHVEIDLVIAKPAPGDVYILCSDGLTKMADDDAIAACLAAEKDPGRAAQALVDLAIAKGGKDNVTVVVVRVQRAIGASSRPPAPGGTPSTSASP